MILHLVALATLASAPSQPAPAVHEGSIREEIEAYVAHALDTYRVKGLALTVVVGERALLTKAWGRGSNNGTEYRLDSPCGLFSATKVLSSLTICQLAQQGELDLDASLGSLREGLPEEWRKIPLWRLLNHTSGITTLFDKPEFQSWSESRPMEDRDVLGVVANYPLDYSPGTYSRYRQSGYGIAADLIAEQLDRPWVDLVESVVCQPAGMRSTMHQELAEGGNGQTLLAAAGNFLTTARDVESLFLALNTNEEVSASAWSRQVLQEERITAKYGLGVVLMEIGGEATLGHSGGAARANVRYAPQSKVGVAAFTDQVPNHSVTIRLTDAILARIVTGQALPTLKQPLALALQDLRDSPVKDMVARYHAGKPEGERPLDMSRAEADLNELGYDLLSRGRQDDAVAIFRLNAAEHPDSANVHDSLGEGLLEAGDRAGALIAYRKAVELDPTNDRARAIIRDLEPGQSGSPGQDDGGTASAESTSCLLPPSTSRSR